MHGVSAETLRVCAIFGGRNGSPSTRAASCLGSAAERFPNGNRGVFAFPTRHIGFCAFCLAVSSRAMLGKASALCAIA